MLIKDDFLDIIHANTEAVEIDGKFVIVLRDTHFTEVIQKILERMMNNLSKSDQN